MQSDAVTTNAFSYAEVPPRPGPAADLNRLLLQHEVEEFLYYEADVLDQWRYREWLELTTEDIRYWVPLRRNVKFGQWDRERSSELSELAWIDEGRATLERRVEQLMTGIHWAAEPLSRISHLVTNVRVSELSDDDEVIARSRFLVYTNHLEDEETILIGKREDVLRRGSSGFRLARRSVFLDQSVLLAKNLTFLF
jgi:3-phenylpropionate/cinnamic acid dioxygenase small subunit